MVLFRFFGLFVFIGGGGGVVSAFSFKYTLYVLGLVHHQKKFIQCLHSYKFFTSTFLVNFFNLLQIS